MDSAGKISTQISDYIAEGQPSKGLKVAARHYQDADCLNSLIFCLVATHAAVRSEQPFATRRRLMVRYLKLVAKCPEYHRDVELNFWFTQAADAAARKKPILALIMYRWVLELQPDRHKAQLVENYIRKINDDYPGVVVRDKLSRKELSAPVTASDGAPP